MAELDTIKEFLGDSPITGTSVLAEESTDNDSVDAETLVIREFLGDN